MSKNIVCCVCKKVESDAEDSVQFFSFPKTQQLKEKWTKILNIKNKAIPEDYAVCSLHFLNSDIKDGDGTPTLKRTAVPLNKTIVQVNTADEVLSESSTSKLSDTQQEGAKKRVKHKMVPVDKSDSSCHQLLATEGPAESEFDCTGLDEKTLKIKAEQETDIPKKRKRMETLDSDDEKKSFLLEDIDGSQQSVCSTNSSEGVTINKVKLAEDSHANIKLQKRRKKIETRYQKALMKLHELIKCLDSIGEKFSVEGISRKVLRAPKNSKLFQFFSPSSSNIATTEQINIEIVDDELNVVKEANIDLPSEATTDVKTEEFDLDRKKFLKRKLGELVRAGEAKRQKINKLKLILKQKADIIQELEAEVANLKNIVTTSEPEHE